MRLGNLCPDLAGPDAELNVTGFAIDHRKIAPGTIFGAFKGARFDAEDFIGEAVANGAVAIVASTAADVRGAVHIAADNPRAEFAKIAAGFFKQKTINTNCIFENFG